MRKISKKESRPFCNNIGTILENIGCVCVLDQHWRLTYLNSHARKLLQSIENGEVIAGNIWDVFPNSSTTIRQMLDKSVSEQVPVRFEAHSSITNRWYFVSAFPSPEGLFLYFDDITELKENQDTLISEKKRYEQELARLDRLNLVGEMAAGIAHEVRNPMTVVRGYLQLLQNEEELAAYGKRFTIMIEELDRANSIVSEFLALARNTPSDMTRQSINSILIALSPLIKADATKNGIAVSMNLSDIPELNLDERKIRQLILNLTRNGLEAMRKKGVLTIETYADVDEVVLAVKDQGEGIPPEVLEKLGTPFFTTKDQGTGLGLSVSYRIAEYHNAKIQIETGPAGTAFMVRFKIP